MMAAPESNVGVLSAEAQAEKVILATLIALVKTPADILGAIHYLDKRGHTEGDELRETVFEAVMQEAGADFVRAWDEISFCRMVGEPIAHIVRIGPDSEEQAID